MVGRGCAFLDFDGDGDLDVVLAENGGPARLFRNDNATGNHWVAFTLRGDGDRNRDAIGAEVTVEAGGRTRRRYVTAARGYLSQSELTATVGLGAGGGRGPRHGPLAGPRAGACRRGRTFPPGRRHELATPGP